MPKPESDAVPSKPLAAEEEWQRSTVCIYLTPGSYPLNSSQFTYFEALNRKAAAAVSSAIILSEYLFDQNELSDKSNAILIQLKLDLAAVNQFSWRPVHNYMIM